MHCAYFVFKINKSVSNAPDSMSLESKDDIEHQLVKHFARLHTQKLEASVQTSAQHYTPSSKANPNISAASNAKTSFRLIELKECCVVLQREPKIDALVWLKRATVRPREASANKSLHLEELFAEEEESENTNADSASANKALTVSKKQKKLLTDMSNCMLDSEHSSLAEPLSTKRQSTESVECLSPSKKWRAPKEVESTETKNSRTKSAISVTKTNTKTTGHGMAKCGGLLTASPKKTIRGFSSLMNNYKAASSKHCNTGSSASKAKTARSKENSDDDDDSSSEDEEEEKGDKEKEKKTARAYVEISLSSGKKLKIN